MLSEQKFLDDKGRLRQWPSKQGDKLLALAYLATKFDFEDTYSESQVNDLLKDWHTFQDWPLLRRELYEHGFLDRNLNGSDYHIKRINTKLPGLYLTTPNIKTDPAAGVAWLAGEQGRETLRLMGNTEADNHPSTLRAEEERIREFIVSTHQRTWSLQYESRTVGAIWVFLEANEYLGAPSLHIMIGDSSARRKGIGQAAMETVLNLLDQEQRHRVIYSRYLVGNDGSAKLLANVGFMEDGAKYADADGLTFQNVKRSY